MLQCPPGGGGSPAMLVTDRRCLGIRNPNSPAELMAKEKGSTLSKPGKEDNSLATQPSLLHKQTSLFSVKIILR